MNKILSRENIPYVFAYNFSKQNFIFIYEDKDMLTCTCIKY